MHATTRHECGTHVTVRNLTGAAQTLMVTIEYPGEKGPQQTALAPLALGPYATEDFAVDTVFGMLPLPLPFCSIRIQYSGAPGSAIAEVSSVESKGDLVIDSRLANEGDGWAGSGAHPWHLDDETESILFLTNAGDRDCPIGFRLQAEGVSYFLDDLKLAPHETRAIDIRKLRDAQEPDFLGNKIPASATDGSVTWIRIEDVPVMGRLVVLRRKAALASNYDCQICQCPPNFIGVRVTPTNGSNLAVGETKQFYADARLQDCNAVVTYMAVTGTASWSTGNTSVATVNNTTSKGLVTARGAAARTSMRPRPATLGRIIRASTVKQPP